MITDRVLVVCEADGFGGGVGVPVGRSGNRECGQLARGDLQRVGQGDDLGEGDGALVRFTVDADGTATGHPISKVAFMPLRTQRTPDAEVPDLDVGDQDGNAEVSETTTPPWLVAATVDARWAISTRITSCRWGHRPPTARRPQHRLWFADNASRSWALAQYDRAGGPYRIRQHGSRHLWDEIEDAYRWWCAQGEPPLARWRLSISSDQQTAGLR